MGWEDEGVETEESEGPEGKEVLLWFADEIGVEKLDDRGCVVEIGREGDAAAGFDEDMQRVGGTGRLGRNNLGARKVVLATEQAEDNNVGSSIGAPEGTAAAQAKMPAEPLPIHWALGEKFSGKSRDSSSSSGRAKDDGTGIERR